jgi:hypothetical protein
LRCSLVYSRYADIETVAGALGSVAPSLGGECGAGAARSGRDAVLWYSVRGDSSRGGGWNDCGPAVDCPSSAQRLDKRTAGAPFGTQASPPNRTSGRCRNSQDVIQHLVHSCASLSKLSRLDLNNNRVAAWTGELGIAPKPSNRLSELVTALRAGDVDLVVGNKVEAVTKAGTSDSPPGELAIPCRMVGAGRPCGSAIPRIRPGGTFSV